jgi:Cof subfamily protein (haloacid dehalogenase superfamily)
MNKKLIALDVDGTLLNDRHEITANTKLTLQQADKQGIRIVLCTGRGPSNALPVMEQLGLEGLLIAHNGALTVTTPELSVIQLEAFAIEDVRCAIEYCRAKGIHCDVSSPYELHADHVTEVELAMYEKHLIVPQQVDDILELDIPVVKLTLFGSPEQLDEAEPAINSLQLPDHLYTLRSHDYFLDIMSRSASKGTALRRLTERLGLVAEEVVAIGNYYNDIDMIQFAGLGIAVDNSPDSVKAAADYVTLSNNDEGVHAALQALVLGKLEDA